MDIQFHFLLLVHFPVIGCIDGTPLRFIRNKSEYELTHRGSEQSRKPKALLIYEIALTTISPPFEADHYTQIHCASLF